MPGITLRPDTDLTDLLSKVPEKNKVKVLKAVETVFGFCSSLSDSNSGSLEKEWGTGYDIRPSLKQNKAVAPMEWETAYDMRPWCAFPERS